MEEPKGEHHEHGAPHIHVEHHTEHHGEHQSGKGTVIYALLAVLAIILVIQLAITAGLKGEADKKVAAAEEAAKPAVLSLIAIRDSSCKRCFDISPAIESVKKGNVEIKYTKDVDLKDAKDLVSKYSITRVPTVILTGDIDKVNLAEFDKSDDALVFSQQKPPFTDATSGEIKGLVKIVQIVDSTCGNCTDYTTTIESLRKLGVGIKESLTFDYTTPQGKIYVDKYALGAVPTLIMSADIEHYPEVLKSWDEIGTKENDGSYVMRTINPPFVNLATGKVEGIVTVTYLVDSKCSTCYDVMRHKQILQGRYRVAIGKENTYDIGSNDGKALVEEYKLTAVPTMILSKEISAYPLLTAIWDQIGTVEADGSYIFRDVAVMGGDYRNITSNEIVKYVAPQQEAAGQ